MSVGSSGAIKEKLRQCTQRNRNALYGHTMMTQRNAMMTRGRRSTIRHERQRPAGDDADDGHDLLYGTNGNDDDRAATTRCTNGNDPLYGFPFLTNPHGLTS